MESLVFLAPFAATPNLGTAQRQDQAEIRQLQTRQAEAWNRVFTMRLVRHLDRLIVLCAWCHRARLEIVATLDSGFIDGRFGCCGLVDGTFTATRRQPE